MKLEMTKCCQGRLALTALAGLGLAFLGRPTPMQGAGNPLPHAVNENGHHALIVEGHGLTAWVTLDAHRMGYTLQRKCLGRITPIRSSVGDLSN